MGCVPLPDSGVSAQRGLQALPEPCPPLPSLGALAQGWGGPKEGGAPKASPRGPAGLWGRNSRLLQFFLTVFLCDLLSWDLLLTPCFLIRSVLPWSRRSLGRAPAGPRRGRTSRVLAVPRAGVSRVGNQVPFCLSLSPLSLVLWPSSPGFRGVTMTRVLTGPRSQGRRRAGALARCWPGAPGRKSTMYLGGW